MEKEKKSRRREELYYLIGTIAVLVVVFFIAQFIFTSLNKIKYEGLTFSKENFGEIPVFRYSYYIDKNTVYNLYVRKDPRKNFVPLTGRSVDDIFQFRREQEIYLSVDPNRLVGCQYAAAGIGGLTSFLVDNKLFVRGASPNRTIANETNVPYATCETHPNDFVILIQGADRSEVVQINDHCYYINIANCEVLETIERFELQAVIDARNRVS